MTSGERIARSVRWRNRIRVALYLLYGVNIVAAIVCETLAVLADRVDAVRPFGYFMLGAIVALGVIFLFEKLDAE